MGWGGAGGYVGAGTGTRAAPEAGAYSTVPILDFFRYGMPGMNVVLRSRKRKV